MKQQSTVTTDQPLVSVITPSYNQGKFIRATIESVLQQDYPNIEYIVNDGGSTDETVSILEEYTGKIDWVSEKDDGQTDAINKGLEKARGEIIAYLNSDDVYLPGTIQLIVNKFREYPDVDFLYGDHHAIDANGKIISKVMTIPFDRNILLYDANYICQPASFYRKRLFEKIGPFDSKLHYLMDYELFLRAAYSGIQFRFVNNYLAAIRYHGDCKTLTGFTPWAEERRVLKSNYARPYLYHPVPMKILSIVFRLKRYLMLIFRGRLDFMNIALSLRKRNINAD